MTTYLSSSVPPIPNRAILLAAGYGSRLRPYTTTIPKCLIPIGGKPLIEHTIEWLAYFGIQTITINLHYLSEQIIQTLGNGKRWNITIEYVIEPLLCGTAGAVRNIANDWNQPFIVWYADNLSNCRIDRLWNTYSQQPTLATIALYKRSDPWNSGIVEINEHGQIINFLEKPTPDNVFSNLVNAGIMIINPNLINHIPEIPNPDFSYDIWPLLLSKGASIYGYCMDNYEGLWWIDTVNDLKNVQQQWKNSFFKL